MESVFQSSSMPSSAAGASSGAPKNSATASPRRVTFAPAIIVAARAKSSASPPSSQIVSQAIGGSGGAAAVGLRRRWLVDRGAIAGPAGGGARGDVGGQRGRQPGAHHQLAHHVARLRAVEAGHRGQHGLGHRDRVLAGVVFGAVQDLFGGRGRISPERVDRRPGLARAHAGHEQEAVDVDEAAQRREPGRPPLTGGGAQAIGQRHQRGGTQEVAIRRRRRPARPASRLPRPARAARASRRRPAAAPSRRRRGEEPAQIEALVGDRVRDLVEQRDALAVERQEVGDQQPLRRGIVGRDRRRRRRPPPTASCSRRRRRSGRAASGSAPRRRSSRW